MVDWSSVGDNDGRTGLASPTHADSQPGRSCRVVVSSLGVHSGSLVSRVSLSSMSVVHLLVCIRGCDACDLIFHTAFLFF